MNGLLGYAHSRFHSHTHPFPAPQEARAGQGGARFNLMLGKFPSSGHQLVTKWERLRSLAH